MAEEAIIDKKAAKRAEKMRKKEEKKRKKQQGADAAADEDEDEGGIGSKIAVVLVTLLIVVIWVAILALLVRLDVGGFGSTVLYPILKDVPYVNRILPDVVDEEEPVVDVQYPYATLEEAINRIKELEVELSQATEASQADVETIAQLQAEITRLQQFENEQAAFQEEKTKFYNEVVFSDNAPDIDEYRQYYEEIEPANAAEIYRQVVQQQADDEALQDYVNTYANMDEKDAATILESMTDDLNLVAKILGNMDSEHRAAILGAMDTTVAAQLTKLLQP